jgi:hypothetical protein
MAGVSIGNNAAAIKQQSGPQPIGTKLNQGKNQLVIYREF